jgi:hypothetical protein
VKNIFYQIKILWLISFFFPFLENPLFQCNLLLPPNAVVHEECKSYEMPRKKLAKMSAALKMCELLVRLRL